MPGRSDRTIAAVQTPPGKGGIAVIALAGPQAERILSQVFRPAGRKAPVEGGLQLGQIVAADGPVDQAIVARTPQGIEINIHGGPAATRAALELLRRCGAAVKPPEQLAAETLPPAHPRWQNPAIGREMLEVLPSVAGIEVAAAVSQQWHDGLSRLVRQALSGGLPARFAAQLRAARSQLPAMRRLLDPAEVVLAGPPNAGKSRLANALIGREASIVHAAAGTTRDWVRELALLDGVPVWLTDTAGIWEAPAGLDAEAVRRARHRAEQADLVVLVGRGAPPEAPDWLDAEAVLPVAAQCDVCPIRRGEGVLAVSAVSGTGLGALRHAILDRLGVGEPDLAAPAAFTERQAALLDRAAGALDEDARRRAEELLAELLEGPPGR